MTDPMAQVDLERRMLDLVEDGERILHDITAQGRKAAKARRAYKVAKARALLSQTDGTIPEREARATVETDEQLLAHETADALLTAAIESGRSNREAQATMRSINANHRALVT